MEFWRFFYVKQINYLLTGTEHRNSCLTFHRKCKVYTRNRDEVNNYQSLYNYLSGLAQISCRYYFLQASPHGKVQKGFEDLLCSNDS